MSKEVLFRLVITFLESVAMTVAIAPMFMFLCGAVMLVLAYCFQMHFRLVLTISLAFSLLAVPVMCFVNENLFKLKTKN
jgi:hypothetical protein